MREVTPSIVDSSIRLKTPGVSEDMVICSLSNWRGEYWSIESKMPLSYSFFAVYKYEPNWGVWPVFWRSRIWKYCFVNGRIGRFFLKQNKDQMLTGEGNCNLHTPFLSALYSLPFPHNCDNCQFALPSFSCAQPTDRELHPYFSSLAVVEVSFYACCARHLRLHSECLGSHLHEWSFPASPVQGGLKWQGPSQQQILICNKLASRIMRKRSTCDRMSSKR